MTRSAGEGARLGKQSAGYLPEADTRPRSLAIAEAIIIGAGPAGLSLALRLHQTTNITPIIYELRPEPTTLGGAVGIPSNGLRLLDRLGVYKPLLNLASSASDLTVYSITGNVLGRYDDLVADARKETGYGYMRVKRVELVDALLAAIREAGIAVHFGKKVTEIREGEDRVHVAFEDGSSDSADILLGCDGIHSAVRKIYVDPEQNPEYTGLAGLFSLIPALNLSPSAVEQIRGLNTTLTEEGMFLVAPCTANKDEVFWGFQRETPMPNNRDARDGWELHGRKEVDEFKKTLHGVLQNATGDWGNTLRALVDQTSVMKFYPVYRLPLGGPWSRGRCLLLGDAAHAMQPHASQGVSMALEDSFLIARLLADRSRGVVEACEAFCRIRRPRVEEIYHAAAQNAGIRKKTGPWGLWVKENFIRLSFYLPFGMKVGGAAFGKGVTGYDIDEEAL
ncbi:hypothetical protein BJY04DRAFT_213972 [Aspergillus karnatakaensis]|uniref:FAD-dependent oxidoreductase n=1 Tax=Aspergillus karnatakaensis TaxID=1810916 RepID=UPI003CCCD239